MRTILPLLLLLTIGLPVEVLGSRGRSGQQRVKRRAKKSKLPKTKTRGKELNRRTAAPYLKREAQRQVQRELVSLLGRDVASLLPAPLYKKMRVSSHARGKNFPEQFSATVIAPIKVGKKQVDLKVKFRGDATKSGRFAIKRGESWIPNLPFSFERNVLNN